MQSPPFSFSNLSADRIVSISAIVVSLGTLFLFMYENIYGDRWVARSSQYTPEVVE